MANKLISIAKIYKISMKSKDLLGKILKMGEKSMRLTENVTCVTNSLSEIYHVHTLQINPLALVTTTWKITCKQALTVSNR